MRSICVFCGARPGQPAQQAAARKLAEDLVNNQQTLVYGGAKTGIMGLIADATLELGGRVIGVMPEHLVNREVAHRDLTELHIVQTLEERKAKMAALSDGFIALPGGIGTLDELFEMLTWSQLELHFKPSGLLNVDGYYDHLITFLQRAQADGLILKPHADWLQADTNSTALLNQMQQRWELYNR